MFVIENGVVKQTSIQLGERQSKAFEVVSGLKGDEVLGASNLNKLASGIRVVTGDEESSFAGRSPQGDGQ